MTYDDIIKSLPKVMKYDDDIDRVALLKRILVALGTPQSHMMVMHICGTNGKGSTGMMVRAFLQAGKQRVGHFSSPALYDDLEQISFNGENITPHEFETCYQALDQAYDRVGVTQEDISIFETFFLVAVIYFAKIGVDTAIFECGLGGALDATNALGQSDYTIFTKIALDHTRMLGNTTAEIAENKSKIIDPHSTVIAYPAQAAHIQEILSKQAKREHALFITQTPYVVTLEKRVQLSSWVRLNLGKRQQVMLPFHLIGTYQVDNLQNALNWLYVYQQQHPNFNLSDDQIMTVVQQVVVPGRMELVHQKPAIYIDGAHNVNAFEGLVKTLGTTQRYHLIVGFLKDKDYADCIKLLSQLNADFILTEPLNPERALNLDQLKQSFELAGISEVRTAKNLTTALQQVSDSLDPIIVTGSFYLINQVVPLIEQEHIF